MSERVFVYSQAVSDAMLAELKQCFMEAYDDNQDGKIDIREVSATCDIYSDCPNNINTTCMYHFED